MSEYEQEQVVSQKEAAFFVYLSQQSNKVTVDEYYSKFKDFCNNAKEVTHE